MATLSAVRWGELDMRALGRRPMVSIVAHLTVKNFTVSVRKAAKNPLG